MGFNSTIVINNDHLHSIANDKDFGNKVGDAILSLNGLRTTVEINGCAVAVETHHSSGTIPVLVGGYSGTVVKGVYLNNNEEDPSLQLLKQLAKIHGYYLRKKP